MMGRAFNACTRRLEMTGIRDTQCGFKLFSADAARRIFPHQRIAHFGFDVEVLWIARRLGLQVAEIPVTGSTTGGAPSARSPTPPACSSTSSASGRPIAGASTFSTRGARG
jgi:hypothetical protein